MRAGIVLDKENKGVSSSCQAKLSQFPTLPTRVSEVKCTTHRDTCIHACTDTSAWTYRLTHTHMHAQTDSHTLRQAHKHKHKTTHLYKYMQAHTHS